MVGSETQILKMLDGASKRFVIPVYQRNYDWKIENCRQLYDDLVKVMKQDRDKHFFGSIVNEFNNHGKQDEYYVIDGQQRITTISLLLLAMYNLLQEGKIAAKSPNLGERIYETYLVDKWEAKETRIKLKPVKNDQRALERLFDSDEEPIKASNVTQNYLYFYERIQRQELTIDALYDALLKLEIIEIKLGEKDNAQMIFESLNSTGLDLTEGDKIRNYVLMGQEPKTQTTFYEKYWNPIEENTNYDVSAFIRDYLSIKLPKTPTISKVYVTFKDYVEQNMIPIEDLLKELLQYAKLYRTLLFGHADHSALSNAIFRLNRLDMTVTRPFLLEVLRLQHQNEISEQDVLALFTMTESYIFRRIICELPTNALNKVFQSLSRDAHRFDGTSDQYAAKCKYVLLAKAESARFPTDEEFADGLEERQIYQMTGRYKSYLFERLENYGTKETKATYDHMDNGIYSIEHIMPQHLTKSWKDSLGENYQEIHSRWLHKLANLTLTAYNSKYSNSPFETKRDMENGFKDSGLRMNQRIAQLDRWGEAELIERSNALKVKALQIWQAPLTDYEPPVKELNSFSLADEEHLVTGLQIAKYQYLDLEENVSTWRDMYCSMILHLHLQDKTILSSLVNGNSHREDFSSHILGEPPANKSTYPLDEGLYLWIGISNSYKLYIQPKGAGQGFWQLSLQRCW